MQKCRNGNALLRVGNAVHVLHTGAVQNIMQTLVHVEAMAQKSALKVAVIARACGSGEKVAALRVQKSQQLVCTLSLDILVVDL